MPASCQLCHRVPKRGTTAHHLIPRTCHSNKWFKKNFTRDELSATVDLCRDCHHAVHQLIPEEKKLGRHYHSLERLRTHPKISRFIRWIRKQR